MNTDQLILVSYSSACATNESRDSQGSYEKLMADCTTKMLKTQSYAEAEKCFRDAMKLSKQLQARALDSLAEVLDKQRKRNEADKCFRQRDELLGIRLAGASHSAMVKGDVTKTAIEKKAEFNAGYRSYRLTEVIF